MPGSIQEAKFLTPAEKAAWMAAVASTDASAQGAAGGDCAALKSALTCPVVYCSGTWRAFYATALYGGARAHTSSRCRPSRRPPTPPKRPLPPAHGPRRC
jgi:hypothetical protein